MEGILDLFYLFAFGALGGFLAGLLGIGGGIVYVVILSSQLLAYGIPENRVVPFIIANSMFAILFGGISGTIKQYRAGNFFIREILLCAIPASLTAILLTAFIANSTWYSRHLFNLIFIGLMSVLAVKILIYRNEALNGPEKVGWHRYGLVGFGGGILAALSGVGGGVIMVPFLTNFMKIKIRKATGISLGVMVVMTATTSVFNLFHVAPVPDLEYTVGLIVLPIVVPLAIGGLVFSPLGVAAAARMKAEYIRLLFVAFLMVVMTRLIYQIL